MNDKKDQSQHDFLNKECAKSITNKALELIILPTEKCNFRCTYCYEDFFSGKMKPDVVSSIKKLLENRSKNLNHLRISWFGGEPLIAKDIILDICQHAKLLAEQYSSLNYSSNMITNAYFLDLDTAYNLANLGVRKYQVTLDGPCEVHNQSRLRADGKGTFDTIWENLIAIRDSSLPVNISLRLHFSANTYELMDPLIADLKREFVPDKRFSFYFKAIERLGGANDRSIEVFPEKEKSKVTKLLESKLFDGYNDSPQNDAIVSEYICYASKPNSLVIRANGRVGKCTVALADERNDVGLLQLDGTFKLIPERFAPWIRGIDTLDIETLGCPLAHLPTSEDTFKGRQSKELIVQV